MPLLVVERGNDKGLTVQVEAEKGYVVGRDNPQAAVKIQDPLLSRTHFEIRARNGSFVIRDMKSRNGTLLNDEKLDPEKESALRIGDKIQAGETIFSFLSDEKEEAPGGLIGKVIGGYRLLERVGRGGMGTVYKAEQISLNRQVALKVLSSKLMSDNSFVERFVQEARSAGGLNHPNIVSVFDVGSDRGIHYFSMEYMEHGSVGDIVAREGPVPWERALEMLFDAARGLIFAEKRGIIHRDIKPDNLMLTSEGIVKIGDLGLAKKAEDVTGEGGGQIFGTPHFIAPEQAQGKPIDHRADLYALGATFYRVLSGKTPFSGENVKEILVKQVREEPTPLQKLVPGLPDEMAAVVGKMMRKNPDDRYRSAQGLLEDLERIRIRYHLESHGHAASARRTKVIAVVLFLGVVALGGVAWHFASQEPKERIVEVPRPEDNGPRDTTPVVVAPTPAELAEAEYKDVYNQDLALQLNLGKPKDTWRTGTEKWLAIAAKYEAIDRKYPGTPMGEKSASRAKEIRDTLEKSRREDEERRRSAKAALDALLAAADALAAKEDWHGALEKLALEGSRLLAKEREYLPDDAEKVIAQRIADIIETLKKRAEALVTAAEAAAPKFPGTEYRDVRTRLVAFWNRVRPPREAPALPPDFSKWRDELTAVAGRLRESLIATKAAALEAARDALDADRAAFFRTYLEIRRWAPTPEDGKDPEEAVDTGPFFSYRWEEALKKWEELRGTLRTSLYRDRVAGKIAQYRRCRRLFETLGARVRAREIDKPQFPDSVKRGTNVVLDGTQWEKNSAEGVHVLRLPSRQKDFVPFREMTPTEIYDLFLNRGEGIPFTGEDHLDLAVFLAEAGAGDRAWTELTAATLATPPAAIEPGLKAWIEAESIILGHLRPLLDQRAAYERAREEGRAHAVVEEMRKRIEAEIDRLFAMEIYFTTDFAILNRSQAGPAGPVPERLFPDEVTKKFVRNYGLPGEPPPSEGEEPGGEPENGDAGIPGDGDTAAGPGGEAGGSPPTDGGSPAESDDGNEDKTEKGE